MHKKLKHRLLLYFYLVIGFIYCGSLFSLVVVSNIDNRSKLLTDKYWQDNNLIAEAHSLLGEVLLFIDNPTGVPEAAENLRQLQSKIDRLSASIATSTFREDFRIKQAAQLRQLRESLDIPAETLSKIKTREKIINQIKTLSTEFRERSKFYTRNTIDPTRNMIEDSLSLIFTVLLVSLGLGVMSAVILSDYFAERIHLPLKNAAEALIRIEKGEYEARAALSGIYEIDMIVRGINSLAISLQRACGQTNRGS